MVKGGRQTQTIEKKVLQCQRRQGRGNVFWYLIIILC